MSYYSICPICGACLDPGERCDCEDTVRNAYKILPSGRAVIYLQGKGQRRATLVDAQDLHTVLSFPGKWYAQRRRWTWYAAATAYIDGRKVTVRLHRLLCDPPEGYEVDHVDHDGLNNTRQNLRVVTPEQNKANLRDCGRDIEHRWYEAGCRPCTAPAEVLPY